MAKGTYVTDIRPGTQVQGIFCVDSKRLLETKSGAPYLALTLVDRSGRIEARMWDQAPEVDGIVSRGDYVHIRGEAQRFREAVQLRLIEVRPVEEDVDPALFLPATDADIDALWGELQKFMKGIGTPALATLLHSIFRDLQIGRAFRQAPAAKRMHHACIGGLLEHTVSVARLAEAVCGLYPHLDRDLLLAAALLHDIGKIEEFSFRTPPIEYSDKGRLLGHLVLGVSIIERFAGELNVTDSAGKITALKHLVLSHHGQREFGAPVLPMMEEALVLHLLDDMDAKLNYLNSLKRDIPGPGHGWTEYQRLLERYFYLPGTLRTEEDRGGDEAGDTSRPAAWSGRQPRLWPPEEHE